MIFTAKLNDSVAIVWYDRLISQSISVSIALSFGGDYKIWNHVVIGDLDRDLLLQTIETLKADNQRLKDENGALIRVISKLSK